MSKKNTKARLAEIDILRGVTILLVVFSHVGMPEAINDVLKSIRMPLFFLVSGYLFSTSKYLFNVRNLIEQRVYSLLIPYFSACALFYFLSFPINIIKGLDNPVWYQPIFGIIYGNGAGLEDIYGIPIWFLVSLFCALIIFTAVLKLVRKFNVWAQFVVFLLVGISGYAVSRFVHLPWGLDIALVAGLFLFTGYRFKELQIFNKMRIIDIVTVIAAVIFSVTVFYNSPLGPEYSLPVGMNSRNYNNIILFYIAGISGSILVFKLSKLMKESKFITAIFSYMGKNSLPILIFHLHSAMFLNVFIFESFSIQTGFNWLLLGISAICLSLIANEIIKKIPLLNFLFNGVKNNKIKSQIKKTA